MYCGKLLNLNSKIAHGVKNSPTFQVVIVVNRYISIIHQEIKQQDFY